MEPLPVPEAIPMSDKRSASSRAAERPAEPGRSQISGARKDEFIRGVLQDVPNLDEELATQVAEQLCGAIDVIKTDRSLIERHLRPKFDPHAFSLMKVYR